jgi:hypothetical protein
MLVMVTASEGCWTRTIVSCSAIMISEPSVLKWPAWDVWSQMLFMPK